jgi:hypothetical protein
MDQLSNESKVGRSLGLTCGRLEIGLFAYIRREWEREREILHEETYSLQYFLIFLNATNTYYI